MNKFVKDVSSSKVEYEFLRSLNGLLRLTDREIEVLSIIISVDSDIRKSKKTQSVDTARVRKLIMSETGITRDNLCRYIKQFREKGLLLYDPETKMTKLNNALIPIVIGGKAVQITLILKINESK